MIKKLGTPAREVKSGPGVRLSLEMLRRISLSMTEGSYNKKQQSKWISEAIESFHSRASKEPSKDDVIGAIISFNAEADQGKSRAPKLTVKALEVLGIWDELAEERANTLKGAAYKGKSQIIRMAIWQRLFIEGYT